MKINYRYSLYITTLLLILSSEVYAQWKQVTTIPPPYDQNYYLEVTFLKSDPRYGWCCGFNGMVIRTTDSGNTWSGTTIYDGGQLESINFVDKLNGYTSGINGSNIGRIFKTTDGGATWRDVTPQPVVTILWGNYFLTPDFGMVIGGGCDQTQNFFRTTDGGRTWDDFTANLYNSGLTDLVLYSDNGLGFAVSSGRLWRTLDGGKTWNVFSVTGAEDWQEEITHVGNSFLLPYSEGCTGSYSGNGGMRMTTNNGASWKEFNTHEPMFGTFLLDEKRGWACGFNKAVYYTSDGGDTWVLRNCGILPGKNMDDIWFINDTLGWVVGQGVYITHNYDTLKPEITATGSIPMCEGDSVELAVKSTYNYYSWSTGETTRSINVKKPGMYSVIVSNSMCDSSISNTIQVSLLPQPMPVISSTKPTFCEGDSAILSVSPVFSKYLWSTGDTTNGILVSSGGDYSVTVTDLNGCTNTVTIPIQVFPNPQPIINIKGSQTICTGDTVTLEIPGAYTKYYWFDDSTSTIIDSTSNKILVTKSGKFYAVVTNNNGCEGKTQTVIVNVLLDSNRLNIQYLQSSAGYLPFDSTHIFDINCKQILITNIGPSTVILSDIILSKNIAFSVPQSQLPFVIQPGESKQLTVCYSPTVLGLQTDNLNLTDNCSPHIVPLEGIGEANIYDANSNCGAAVQLTTTDLQNYLFNVSPPLPNPVSTFLSVPYDKVIPVSGTYDFNENCYLYNSLGERVAMSIINTISTREANNLMWIKAEFNIDVRNLQDGFYLVVVKANNFTKTYPILIYK